MTRFALAATLLFAVFAVAAISASPRAAQACSCPDCDAIRDSDVIVAGTIRSWSRSATVGQSNEIPIDLHIAITTVWKGEAAVAMTLFDPASLVNLTDPARTDLPEKLLWTGGAGGCQAFTDDPTGKFMIIGFVRTGEAANRVYGPALFFLGPSASGDAYDQAVARLSAVFSPRPPDTGNTPASPTAGSDDWMYVSSIGGAMLLFSLVVLLCVRRPR